MFQGQGQQVACSGKRRRLGPPCSPQHLLFDSGWVELEDVLIGGLLAAGQPGREEL